MSDKLTKKELKEPDAFMKVGAEARDWLQTRWKYVAIVSAVVLLGGAGVALASYFSGRGEEQASRQFGEAVKVLSRPVNEGAEQAPPDAKEPPFKSEQEKQEAVRKAFEDFRNEHKGTQAASTAALPLADAYLKLGNYDKAIEAAKEFLKGTPKDEPLRASAEEKLGYAHEGKNEYDLAAAAFQDMAKENKSEFLSGMGEYHAARMLILQGKKDEAAKQLSDLSTSHPGTAAARMAADRLAVLASEGVKIPTPAPASPTDAGK